MKNEEEGEGGEVVGREGGEGGRRAQLTRNMRIDSSSLLIDLGRSCSGFTSSLWRVERVSIVAKTAVPGPKESSWSFLPFSFSPAFPAVPCS